MDSVAEPSVNTKNLQEALERELWRFEPVRIADRPPVLRVHPDGSVEISGTVRTDMNKETILELIANHSQVREVKSQLWSDMEIERKAALIVSEGPTTRSITPGSVLIYSQMGSVTLVGKVANENERQQVVETVKGVGGVYEVLDRLSVR